MSVEKPNDKEMLWVLTLFIDGVLSHETIRNRYLRDVEEKDKESDLRKYELIQHACDFLIQNDFAEESKSETGDQITTLNKNSLEYYRRIKGRVERRDKTQLPAKKSRWSDAINNISTNTIAGTAILLIIAVIGYIIYWIGSE